MNAFSNISVSSTSFPADAQFECPPGATESRYGLALLWKSGAVIVYSFDGTNDHGDLEGGQANQGLTFDDRPIPSRKIWFRVATATTSVVRAEAWVQK
jgi:hypothetical protein